MREKKNQERTRGGDRNHEVGQARRASDSLSMRGKIQKINGAGRREESRKPVQGRGGNIFARSLQYARQTVPSPQRELTSKNGKGPQTGRKAGGIRKMPVKGERVIT